MQQVCFLAPKFSKTSNQNVCLNGKCPLNKLYTCRTVYSVHFSNKQLCNTCRFKHCATDNSSLNEVSYPRLPDVKFILGEYLPFSPCVTLSLYNCSVFSANSASSCCLTDFSELRSLSLKEVKGKYSPIAFNTKRIH